MDGCQLAGMCLPGSQGFVSGVCGGATDLVIVQTFIDSGIRG